MITSRQIKHKTNDINNILIIDSACDQSIIAENSCVVLSRSGMMFYVDGALNGRMESDVPLEVVDAVTMLTMSNGSNIILQMNQSLLDSCPTQYESLLQPHQYALHEPGIDEVAVMTRTELGMNQGEIGSFAKLVWNHRS